MKAAIAFALLAVTPPVASGQAVVGFDQTRVDLFTGDYRPALINDLPQEVDADKREQTADAIRRGLAIVQKAAKNYPSHRQCFSCHHQTLPLLAMQETRDLGFDVDREALNTTRQHTLESFSSRLDKLRDGRGIGGRANTVSYGLWALDLAWHEADETTAAMVAFLLQNQRDNGSWSPPSNRPPLEESSVSTTVLSSYYMQGFVNEQNGDAVEKAIRKSRTWLAAAPLKSQEDHNFRLWSLIMLEDRRDAKVQQQIAELGNKILAAQRDDGGWSQVSDMKSDAYATGQSLYVLRDMGLPSGSVFMRAGVEFLLKTQHDDGSWLVETRSKPVQVYFDNGDPHGKSQFISIAATSWAVAALARMGQAPAE